MTDLLHLTFSMALSRARNSKVHQSSFNQISHTHRFQSPKHAWLFIFLFPHLSKNVASSLLRILPSGFVETGQVKKEPSWRRLFTLKRASYKPDHQCVAGQGGGGQRLSWVMSCLTSTGSSLFVSLSLPVWCPFTHSVTLIADTECFVCLCDREGEVDMFYCVVWAQVVKRQVNIHWLVFTACSCRTDCPRHWWQTTRFIYHCVKWAARFWKITINAIIKKMHFA